MAKPDTYVSLVAPAAPLLLVSIVVAGDGTARVLRQQVVTLALRQSGSVAALVAGATGLVAADDATAFQSRRAWQLVELSGDSDKDAGAVAEAASRLVAML